MDFKKEFEGDVQAFMLSREKKFGLVNSEPASFCCLIDCLSLVRLLTLCFIMITPANCDPFSVHRSVWTKRAQFKHYHGHIDVKVFLHFNKCQIVSSFTAKHSLEVFPVYVKAFSYSDAQELFIDTRVSLLMEVNF